jgi:hypothetical protein
MAARRYYENVEVVVTIRLRGQLRTRGGRIRELADTRAGGKCAPL